jgi:hypothetical protein
MTRGSSELSLQGGGIQSRRTCYVSEPSHRVRSHSTRGSIRALPIREVGSEVTEHVTASEPTLAGR